MESKPYIIIVDDDLDDQEHIKEIVAAIAPALEIRFFCDGEDLINALHEIEEHRPASIILDLIMPKKGGMETLKELSLKKKFSDIPVIIFSTSNDEKIELLSLKMGAKGFVSKPSSYVEMEKTMEYILTRFTPLLRP
jgi:FixJ family two-component response regulator